MAARWRLDRSRRFGRIDRVVVCAVIGTVVVACSGVGQRPAGPAKQILLATEYDERRVGDVHGQLLVDSTGLLEDPALQEYVQRVGARVAVHAPPRSFPYRFQVLAEWTPNALSLPGGFIAITRGLLALTNSEDELAAALAHEVVHSAHRHAAASELLAKKPLVAHEGVWRLKAAAWKRDQERDADRRGQVLADTAGYDPYAMASLLQKLDRLERIVHGRASYPGWFATHPSPIERAAGVSGMPIFGDLRVDRADEAHLERLVGLAVGEDVAYGFFRGTHFLRPDRDLVLSFPPVGWNLWSGASWVSAVHRVTGDMLVVTWGEPGNDPEPVADRVLAELAVNGHEVVDRRSVDVGGRPAAQVRLWNPDTKVAAEHVWISDRGSIYDVAAIAPAETGNRGSLSLALGVAGSIRPLTPEDRASIEIHELALVRARAGESLAALSERTGNRWAPAYTAIMNGLLPDASLVAGQPVKIAVAQAESIAGLEPIGVPEIEALEP